MKVRDIYDEGNYLVLVTTDRQSAFDRVLASIPFKGQVHDSKHTEKFLIKAEEYVLLVEANECFAAGA